jgi:hypothetical protein
MRRILVYLSLLTLVVLSSPPATLAAQGLASDDVIVAEVPFDFVAGERVLPAGTYRVEIVPNDDPPALVTLQTATERARPNEMIFHSVPTAKVKVDDIDQLREQPRLVFSQVAGLNYLERVETP